MLCGCCDPLSFVAQKLWLSLEPKWLRACEPAPTAAMQVLCTGMGNSCKCICTAARLQAQVLRTRGLRLHTLNGGMAKEWSVGAILHHKQTLISQP
jgi:hypothetical protein